MSNELLWMCTYLAVAVLVVIAWYELLILPNERTRYMWRIHSLEIMLDNQRESHKRLNAVAEQRLQQLELVLQDSLDETWSTVPRDN